MAGTAIDAGEDRHVRSASGVACVGEIPEVDIGM